MFNKMLFRFGLRLIIVAGLCLLHDRAVAGEVGTTDDGNVIYLFQCPNPQAHVDFKVNWPNHLSDHPEWDIQDEQAGVSEPQVRALLSNKSRSGQVLECRYTVIVNGEAKGKSLRYRYKVHRDIISCQDTAPNAWKCILKSEGGGKAKSSIESSSPPPEKCVGLGCDTQPNPGECIGMGCDKKSSDAEMAPPGKSAP